MDDLDWNLIKSFVAVAETGSLSAAARRLASSQPTVGRHIAELEREIGVTLFRRGRRGYALTEAGNTLFERGLAVSQKATAFSRLALGSVEAIEGTVRIAASEVMAACVLPAMIARLRIEEPGLEIEIVASNQVENLLRRDADIAVRMVRPAQNELVARKVADIGLRACAAISYLDRRGRPAVFADLAQHDLIGFDRSDDIIRAFASAGLPVTRSAFQFRATTRSCFGKPCAPAMAWVSGSGRLPRTIHQSNACFPTCRCRCCRSGWRCTGTCAAACAFGGWRIFCMTR